MVDDIRPPLAYLEDPLRGHSARAEVAVGPLGRKDLEAEIVEPPSNGGDQGFIGIVDGDYQGTLRRETSPSRETRLRIGHPEGLVEALHLTGRSHLGSEDHIDIEAVEGEYRIIDCDPGDYELGLVVHPEFI